MRGSIIVRLIDIVFILLLGFISTSDIIKKAQVQLQPQLQTGTSRQDQKTQPIVLRILVQPKEKLNQKLLAKIEDIYYQRTLNMTTARFDQVVFTNDYVKYSVRDNLGDGAEALFETVEDLETHLISVQKGSGRREVVLVIVPDPEVMIQGIVNLFDICQQQKIKYLFRYPPAKQRAKLMFSS